MMKKSYMYKVVTSLSVALVLTLAANIGGVYANTKGQNIAYKLEDMRINSQRIPKDYLYIHQGIRVEQSKKQLKESLAKLDDDIQYLTANLKGDENQNLLLFLSFTRDELKEVIKEEYSKENGALMLDFGESLLEGADSILNNEVKSGHAKHTIRLTLEDMIVDLERATKYYIAFQAGFKDHNNIKQMDRAIKSYEQSLVKLKSNKKFAKTHAKDIKKIARYWPIAKKFYSGVEKGDLPLIVFVSAEHMEKSLYKMMRAHDNVVAKK